MSFNVLLISCATIFFTMACGYDFPEVKIIAFSPMGLKASIPARPGLKIFGFHANVNSPIGGLESGEIEGDVDRADGEGRWTVFAERAHVLPGDTLHYWIHVQDGSGSHKREGLEYRVKVVTANGTSIFASTTTESSNPKSPNGTSNDCQPSITKLGRGDSAFCKGQLIFEEHFNERVLNLQKWNIDQKLSDVNKENGFMSYQKQNVIVSNGVLKITPTLLREMEPFNDEEILSGILDLTVGCTSNLNRECFRNALQSSDILPPVVTGKINTKNLFSFKYGKIEIRARLPRGDWLYPELLLEPERSHYGAKGYDSGVVRVAFARGNSEELSVLSGGLLLSQFEPCRSSKRRCERDGHCSWGGSFHANSVRDEGENGHTWWGDSFHAYAVVWNEDEVKFYVDNAYYGKVRREFGGFKKYNSQCEVVPFARWGKGTPFAPFDREMYVSIGLGVGGVSDFPDDVDEKPWRNKAPRPASKFWKDVDKWHSTWTANSSLEVDYVKVWAL